ncbi:MAG: hydroxymethylbilane synthase [Chloroflexi bacterium]|nr:hydroxymethylbilane synthase [Chloroflexota bacterium]
MDKTTTRILTLGTRPSRLARWQTDHVIHLLQTAWPGLECRVEIFETHGDRVIDRPLPEIGGKGVFTEELEAALRCEAIDLAVHSLKDLPIEMAPGLALPAICARGEARDVLISSRAQSIETLPAGARVGTSSLRRSAQLLALRPDLVILPLRGNIDTRLRKALQGEYDAIVLAAAGLLRLGEGDEITQYLPFEVMLPAPGQAALAVQSRAEDAETLKIVAAIDDPATRNAVTAERAFLKALGGGCSAPVAAYASPHGQSLSLTGLVASLDGKQLIRVNGEGQDPEALGAALGMQALGQGAGEILA